MVIDGPNVVLLVELIVQLTGLLRVVKDILDIFFRFQFVNHLFGDEKFAGFDKVDFVCDISFPVEDVIPVYDHCFEMTGKLGKVGACKAGEKRNVFDESNSKLRVVVVYLVLGFREVESIQSQQVTSG